MEIGEIQTNDDPGNVCFGCSPHNPRGLRLAFRRTGERAIEVRWRADPEWCGMKGVIHGGIQATLLDEAMGMAAHTGVADGVDLATVDLALRYLRPAPTERELVARARVERAEGRDVWVAAELQDPDGRTLTTATSRWRILRPTAAR